jgi:hypothetical protein
MTARDRAILMLLPGLAILLLYGGYFVTARQKPLAKLQADVVTARDQVPSAQLMHDRQRALQYAQKQNADALARAKDLEGEFDAKIRPCQTGVGRSQRLTKLTEFLSAHHLQVLDHVPADGAREKALKLSAAQDRLVKQLALPGKPNPQAWQFELYGKFTDLAAALEELGEGELIAVPLAVTMEEIKDVSPQRRWSLLIWI